MDEKPKKSSSEQYCCVKNCHKKLEENDIIRLGDSVFCKSCGTAIVKQSILG